MDSRSSRAQLGTRQFSRLMCGTVLGTLALTLGPVVVAQEMTLSAAQATILDRMVVTATRGTKAVLDVPQTVTVIDRETIDAHVVRDIQDLVRYEPGISVNRQTSITNPYGQLTGFTIRGVGGNRVQMLVDGSRIQEQITDGSRDLVDPWNMQAVELVRGPNSVLWGADALGGVVAFRTRDPADLLEGSDKPWAIEVRTAFDSFDNNFRQQVTGAYDFGDLEILGSIGNLTASEASLSNADPDGGIWGCPRPAYFRCNVLFPAETQAINGLAKAVWTPNADHEITLTGEVFSRQTEIDQVWDSFAENPAYATNPAFAGAYYTSDEWLRSLDMSRTRLALRHSWDVGTPFLDNVTWNVAYSPQHRNTEGNQTRTYPLLATPETREITQIRNYGENFLEADVQLTSSFDLGQSFHTLTYGFDGDIGNTSYTGTNVTDNLTTGTSTTAINQGFNFPQVETTRADLYIQDEVELLDGRLTVTPGVRLATYRIDPTGDPDYVPLPGFDPEPMESIRLLKKFSAIYEIDDSFSVFASYGEGFKMPTSQQLFISSSAIGTTGFVDVIPNPDLLPESVVSYEAGLRGEFETGHFTLSGFYSEYENFIRGLQPVAGVPDTYTSDNVETVQLWGIEAGGEFPVAEDLFAFGSLSWSQGVQQTNAAAAETAFDGAVPLTVVAGLRYELPEHGLELEVLGTFASGVSERSDPAAFKPEGYAVFDAYGTWRPTENVEITAGVQNIFDARYFPNTLSGYSTTPGVSAGANPLELQTAPGRTFKLGATLKF